jgi:hypothetical protein
MAYNAQDISVTIDGSKIYASSAKASTSISQQAVKSLGFALAQGQAPSGPQETTVNVDYYILSNDPVRSICTAILGSPTTYQGTTIVIGGATITKAYLTSLSVSAEPQSLITVSCSFVSFQPGIGLTIGQGSPNNTPNSNLKFAHGASAATTASITNALGFQYEASFQWKPILILGSNGTPLGQYTFDGGTESLTVKGVGAGGTVSFCPATQLASASVGALCGGGGGASYSVTNGSLTAANISADVGGFPEGSFTVTKQL